ncbi:hypothetical protein HS1genome_0570 [Sulfodiicoccus acidiphilus]|uniref:Zinc-ribbon domain-containing protein n=1 Tax=Sulfodiicoccus acidiphilus TaxID=1670455 RepID=A0A348B1X9_9CREN|nr:zinc ribbon domain-containing protein [Sulfodiicoccus acidiphilus]BBD72181.1 hypothetical protein HS1genome_0570 [Sulfodiicoccus acidiphilus]GGT94408.1 hypothetical protein GCM10007116_10000 [Sulfodiicoccus acidiphilus]
MEGDVLGNDALKAVASKYLRRCKECGAINFKEAKFCSSCGAPLLRAKKPAKELLLLRYFVGLIKNIEEYPKIHDGRREVVMYGIPVDYVLRTERGTYAYFVAVEPEDLEDVVSRASTLSYHDQKIDIVLILGFKIEERLREKLTYELKRVRIMGLLPEESEKLKPQAGRPIGKTTIRKVRLGDAFLISIGSLLLAASFTFGGTVVDYSSFVLGSIILLADGLILRSRLNSPQE